MQTALKLTDSILLDECILKCGKCNVRFHYTYEKCPNCKTDIFSNPKEERQTMILFIIKSGKRNASIPVLRASFIDDDGDSLFSEVVEVGNINAINDYGKTVDWYGVLYDNEKCSIGLMDSLPIYFEYGTTGENPKPIEYLVVHRKDKMMKIFTAPRFFRKHVVLQENSLMPINPESLKFEAPLDGWILEQ